MVADCDFTGMIGLREDRDAREPERLAALTVRTLIETVEDMTTIDRLARVSPRAGAKLR